MKFSSFGAAGNTQYKVTILITFTGRGCTLDPHCRDASPLHPDKKLPPLNSAKEDCIPPCPLAPAGLTLAVCLAARLSPSAFCGTVRRTLPQKKPLFALLPSANKRSSKVSTASSSDSAKEVPWQGSYSIFSPHEFLLPILPQNKVYLLYVIDTTFRILLIEDIY